MLGSQLIREVQIDWNRIDRDRKPDLIILQSRSPSCGVKQRYDGSFSGTLVKGSGVTAQLLIENGFQVIDVEDMDEYSDLWNKEKL